MDKNFEKLYEKLKSYLEEQKEGWSSYYEVGETAQGVLEDALEELNYWYNSIKKETKTIDKNK